MANSYPYACGAIKSKENKLLSRNKIIRLSKLDEADFFKALSDAGFDVSSGSFSEILLKEELKIKEILFVDTPDADLTNLFFLSNDAEHIKTIYKAKLYDLTLNTLASNGGFDNEELINLIINNIPSSNNHLNKVIENINKRIDENTSARLLSKIIDTEVLNYALMIAKKKSNVLKEYLVNKIDFINIILIFRIKNLNWSLEDYFDMFIDGGKIKKDFFKEVFNNFDKYLDLFKSLDDEVILKIISKYESTLDLSKLEFDFEQLLINKMSLYKNDSFGLGPIIYYYLAYNASLKNIRVVYTSKEVDISNLLDY